ncbi:MAG: hypothetical protein JXA71_09705 [Chitinispirillaceae bacterium]|nr:hypothetical protein [Chitinispirillaceae bacterium]
MKRAKIVSRAKKRGIKDMDHEEKAELIRLIQIEEGGKPCYSTGVVDCPETDCCWRDECLGEQE